MADETMSTEAVVANLLEAWGTDEFLPVSTAELAALIIARPEVLVSIARRVGIFVNDHAVAEALAFHILDERQQA